MENPVGNTLNNIEFFEDSIDRLIFRKEEKILNFNNYSPFLATQYFYFLGFVKSEEVEFFDEYSVVVNFDHTELGTIRMRLPVSAGFRQSMKITFYGANW